jgi:hypothetical protein
MLFTLFDIWKKDMQYGVQGYKSEFSIFDDKFMLHKLSCLNEMFIISSQIPIAHGFSAKRECSA